MSEHKVRYSIITPSRGDRPVALARAIASVEQARVAAGLEPEQMELLVGFDGGSDERPELDPECSSYTRFFNFRKENNFGNGIRHGLLKISRGQRIVFLDDDNELTPAAFTIYNKYIDVDMVVARIDTSRAFKEPFLPRKEDATKSLIRQGNIDPLCLCCTRVLVVVRSGGWSSRGGYEADYFNILQYSRRALNMAVIDEVVGIYDANAGADTQGMSPLQLRRRRGEFVG